MERWLRVKFGDNDFGTPVTSALERLWQFANNNSVGRGKGSAQATLTLMLEHDVLKLTINRAIDAEYLHQGVEFITRIEKWNDDSKPDYTYAKEYMSPFKSITSDYLGIDISLHDSKGFAKEWCNGEEAWLDLETGDCGTY